MYSVVTRDIMYLRLSGDKTAVLHDSRLGECADLCMQLHAWLIYSTLRIKIIKKATEHMEQCTDHK